MSNKGVARTSLAMSQAQANENGGPPYHYHGIGNNSAGLVISNRKPT